jgi:hypothetical protein
MLEPGSVERVNAGYGIMYQDADETTCTLEGVYIEGFAPLKSSITVEW